MDRLADSVVLKYERTWTLQELGVILNEDCRGQSSDCLVNEDLIGSKFLVPMGRNTYLATGHQRSHLIETLNHCRTPPALMIRSSSVCRFDPQRGK